MDVAKKSRLWTVDAPTRPTMRPVWKDDKVIFYGPGSQKDHSVVFAVNVADGSTAWSTKLKWGYYKAMQLAGDPAHQQSFANRMSAD
ncbi:MAG: hypothetical protein OES79_12110 [Planctomycetota bacterium]|nr:hypothetical protein [Planctomycetota bacterium]